MTLLLAMQKHDTMEPVDQPQGKKDGMWHKQSQQVHLKQKQSRKHKKELHWRETAKEPLLERLVNLDL